MNAARLFPIVFAAAFTGAVGYYIGSRNAPPPSAPEVKPATVKTAPAPAPAIQSTGTVALPGLPPLTAANATEVAYRILEEADPGARMTSAMALIAGMTPENARGVLQAFRDITTKTGRKHDAEWALMLRRYGALRGAEGLQDLMPEMFNVGLAVEGLAARDPDAALAALKAAGLTDPQLTGAWLNGICVKDPGKALTLALSGQYEGANGGALLGQAINCIGVDKAREAMQAAMDAAPAGALNSPVFQGLYGALGDALFHKYWTLNTPAGMLPWLEAQKDEAHLPSRFVARAVHDNMLKGDPLEALAFLERMNAGRETLRGTERLYESVGGSPQIVAGMDEAACARLIKYLPPDPPALMKLADEVEKVNPARAAQLRRALPQD